MEQKARESRSAVFTCLLCICIQLELVYYDGCGYYLIVGTLFDFSSIGLKVYLGRYTKIKPFIVLVEIHQSMSF